MSKWRYHQAMIYSMCFISAMCTSPSKLLAADGDWQAWTEASWIQNLGCGVDVGLRLETRFEEDLSKFAYYEVEPMVAWRYSPRWDFSLGYERDERISPSEEVSHVPNISATLRIPKQPWKIFPVLNWRLSNRFRMDFMVPEDETFSWQAIYRNRTDWEARWRWGSKELVPFVFEEWFFNTDEGEFTENRFGVGLGLPIVPHWQARLYWMRQDQKTSTGWEWHPVVGFQIQTQF